MSFKSLYSKLMTCFISNKDERRAARDKMIFECLNIEQALEKSKKVKLLMTIVLKNEEEIIEQNIRFHYAMGVDGFIVTNHNSTDNSVEILEKLKKEGLVLEIINENGLEHRHSIWVHRMIKIAKNKYNADWVINADADEFYYSNDLNLKISILKYPKINVYKVESTFSFAIETENFLENPYFLKNPLKTFEEDSLEISNLIKNKYTIEGARSCPKVIHKTNGYLKIIDGNHMVSMRNAVVAPCNDIVLYHYNIPSFKRYEDKAKRWMSNAHLLTNGENYLTKIIDMYKDGKLKEYFDSIYGEEIRELLFDKGIVQKDYSVINFMKYNGLV